MAHETLDPAQFPDFMTSDPGEVDADEQRHVAETFEEYVDKFFDTHAPYVKAEEDALSDFAETFDGILQTDDYGAWRLTGLRILVSDSRTEKQDFPEKSLDFEHLNSDGHQQEKFQFSLKDGVLRRKALGKMGGELHADAGAHEAHALFAAIIAGADIQFDQIDEAAGQNNVPINNQQLDSMIDFVKTGTLHPVEPA